MLTMTQFELGKKCLTILQYKIRRNGMELRPEVFEQKVQKVSRLLNAQREEIVAFFKKYLLPEILVGCNLGPKGHSPNPNEREAWIAYRILKIEYFWDLRELREEARSITNKTPLSFEEVAAIAAFIAHKHVRDQFGEGVDTDLNVTGRDTN